MQSCIYVQVFFKRMLVLIDSVKKCVIYQYIQRVYYINLIFGTSEYHNIMYYQSFNQ